MKYRNKTTGVVIETKAVIAGENWQAITEKKEEVKEEPKEEKKAKK